MGLNFHRPAGAQALYLRPKPKTSIHHEAPPDVFFPAAICGTVPAWDSVLGNHPLPAGKDFPIGKARLGVGEFKGEKDLTSSATVVSFTMPLQQG